MNIICIVLLTYYFILLYAKDDFWVTETNFAYVITYLICVVVFISEFFGF